MKARVRVVATGLVAIMGPGCAGAGGAPVTLVTIPTTVTVVPADTTRVTTTTLPATTTSPGDVEPAPVATTAQVGCETTPYRSLFDARRTPAGPYLLHHPAEAAAETPTVMFIPGGTSGTREAAERVWTNYLSNGDGVDDYRIVTPYAVDFDLYDDEDRLLAIVDEVVRCFGGDPERFHVAGYSRGGQIAFDLMLARPDLFATALGAPGEFPQIDPDGWRDRLAGKAVFNGVGELDEEWLPFVRATHDGLVAAGIESVYVEFPGEGHRLSAEFDESIFFEFWASH